MASANEVVLRSWAHAEWRNWASLDWSSSELSRRLCAISDAVPQVFVYEVRGSEVYILPKQNILIDAHAGRAIAYQRLLGEVVAESRNPDLHGTCLAIDLDDGCGNWTDVPVFSFQRPREFRNPLLPDIDFLASDFYASSSWALPDRTAYFEKALKAVFVGSTTGGGIIDQESISHVPRIKSARFFRDHADVDFHLTRIVQCRDSATEARLRREGYGQAEVGWSEQLLNRFLISMDGNGATCSRMYVALRSSCALLKYDSSYELYYFKGLTPWVNYAPICDDRDVLEILAIERDDPGFFEPMAAAGNLLADLLSRENVKLYTAEMLRQYVSLVSSRRST